MTESIATLTSITFECADASVLAAFYGTLLGLKEECASGLDPAGHPLCLMLPFA